MKREFSTEPIESLNLNRRIYNRLRRSGIDTVNNLLEAEKNEQLELIKGLGEKSIQEIRKIINGIKVVEFDKGQETSIPDEFFDKDNDDIEFLNKEIAKLNSAIDEIVSWQKQMIQKQIEVGLLHEKLEIANKTIKHWLNINDIDRYFLFDIYAKVLGSICITEEIADITSQISLRDLEILVGRYGLSPKTYEEIGNEIGVTRERIRQILNRIERQVAGKARRILFPSFRIQTALIIAEQWGLDISYDDWSNSLKSSGLLGNWQIIKGFTHDPVDLLISVCNLLTHEGVQEFSLPSNLQYSISLAADNLPGVPAKNLQIIKTLPKKVKKDITRQTRFTGGIQARWLSSEINYGLSQTKDILLALGYKNLEGDWFIPKKVERQRELSRFDVLDHSVRKMTQYCGPLSVESICGGVMNSVSRTRYPVPAPSVMKDILISRGYTFEDDFFYWNGPINETLNRGEEIILDCMNTCGSVLHHAEIAQAFIESELSFPSIHKTLRISPIIEKIDKGLYKLRGRPVKLNDIERAKTTGDRIPVDLIVNYDKSGKLKVEASLGILVVGTGVLFSDKLPNLVGEWKCIINGTAFDDIDITENEIRRLLKPLEYLQCNVSDRVCFIFDMWTRAVNIEKV